MSWVWEHSATAGNERRVLLAVADTADDDGGKALPSVATLARKTRLAATVQRVIRRLVGGGHLRVEMAAGRGGTNVYTLIMDSVEATPSRDDPRQTAGGGELPGAAQVPPTPRHQRHPTPGSCATRTSLNILEPRPPNPPPAGWAPAWDPTVVAGPTNSQLARTTPDGPALPLMRSPRYSTDSAKRGP